MYLYFRTKEEIYLAVHEQQTHQFFDTLETLLARERSRPSLKRLTRNVVEAIRQHPAFLPLAIQCPEFERNADLDVVARCKAGIGARLQQIGATLETMYPRLKRRRGTAADPQLRSHAGSVAIDRAHPGAGKTARARGALRVQAGLPCATRGNVVRAVARGTVDE